MSDVSLRGISKRYGDSLVVDGLELDIRQGEFLTLLGPSGCGKTTTLRMIAGFVRPTTGRIRIGREDITELEPQKRQIGMVFQDYALFPHLTIAENVAFGLVERGTPREKIALPRAGIAGTDPPGRCCEAFAGGIERGPAAARGARPGNRLSARASC